MSARLVRGRVLMYRHTSTRTVMCKWGSWILVAMFDLSRISECIPRRNQVRINVHQCRTRSADDGPGSIDVASLSMKECPYRVLGLARDANDSDIRKAYLKGVSKWHPDKHEGDPQEAHHMFQLIVNSHEILSNPTKRQSYDRLHRERTVRENANSTRTSYETYTQQGRGFSQPHAFKGFSGSFMGMNSRAERAEATGKYAFGQTRDTSYYYRKDFYDSLHRRNPAAAGRTAGKRTTATGSRVGMMFSLMTFTIGGALVWGMGSSTDPVSQQGSYMTHGNYFNPYDSVDAWKNPATGRWEPPPDEWYSDGRVKQQCVKKPRYMVHYPRKPNTPGTAHARYYTKARKNSAHKDQ